MVASMRVCCAVITVLFLSGCADNLLYRGYSVRPLSTSVATGGSYMKLVEALQKTEGTQKALLPVTCFGEIAKGDKAGCRAQRNQAVSALVTGSGELCLEHRRSMYGNEAMWNMTFGTMTNLFAAAATVVTTEKYRPVLASLALFSNSERSLVNETVYKQMLVTAVDKKILELREMRMATIYTNLKSDIDAYPVQEALRDVVALHSSCSFIDGLQKALDEGTQDSTAKKILRLRQSVHELNLEYEKVDATKNAPRAEGLKKRIDAINAALAAEEIR
jgi:hypothetical protein